MWVRTDGVSASELDSNALKDASLVAALRNADPAMIRELRELEQRRRGEWICPKCGLRQDSTYQKGDF